MAQLRGESSCSQVIEPVVHGPGGQADPGWKLGLQMSQLGGESRCSQVIEPVVHGPGGQADPGWKFGRQMSQLGGETAWTVIVMTSQCHVQAKVLNGRPYKVI